MASTRILSLGWGLFVWILCLIFSVFLCCLAYFQQRRSFKRWCCGCFGFWIPIVVFLFFLIAPKQSTTGTGGLEIFSSGTNNFWRNSIPIMIAIILSILIAIIVLIRFVIFEPTYAKELPQAKPRRLRW